MPSETILEAATAHLRAAGLPEETARTLAGRMAGVLEQLRQQVESLPPNVEPVTTFGAGSPKQEAVDDQRRTTNKERP